MFYYFHRILFKIRFFKYWNVTFNRRINNSLFKIPVIKETGYYNLFDYEHWMDNLLKDLLNLTDGFFVDGGMNIGQTLLKVKSIDAGRTYVGFEPNPICFNCCYLVTQLNSLKNCHVYPVGLFNNNCVLSLYMDKEYASGASVIENFRNNKERYSTIINIPVFKGDDILEKHKNEKAGIVKIDVEGAEPEAVEGLYNTIERDRPFIILEILPVYSLESENGKYRKQREDKLLFTLNTLGYLMYRINEKEQKLIFLKEIAVHNSMALTNYLFVHESNNALLQKFNFFGGTK